MTLLTVLTLLLSACGGAAPTAPPAAQATDAPAAQPTVAPAAQATDAPAPAEVSAAETLIFQGDFSDQISLDPAVAYEFGGIQVVGSIYQTLVTIAPGDPTIKPLVAKSSSASTSRRCSST